MIGLKDKKKTWSRNDFGVNKRIFCKWNNIPIVAVGSNFAIHLPVQKVKRRVKKYSNAIVHQSDLVQLYKTGMGEVDVMDSLLDSCRPTI